MQWDNESRADKAYVVGLFITHYAKADVPND